MIRLANFLKTSSKYLEDVLKMPWRRFEDVLKTSWRHMTKMSLLVLIKMSSEDVWVRRIYLSWWRHLEDVFWRRRPQTSSRHLQDVFIKTNVFWECFFSFRNPTHTFSEVGTCKILSEKQLFQRIGVVLLEHKTIIYVLKSSKNMTLGHSWM